MPRLSSSQADAPAVLSSAYLARALADPAPPATVAAGFVGVLARIMDAPGARGDDARAALAALRDATARAHFAGDARAVAAALACYDGVWGACNAGGDGALPPAAAAAAATELRRETLLLLSAAPATPWAARDALDLRLALLKRVWVWSAAERAAAAAGAPVPAPASPAALKRTASGRAPPPGSFEGVVAALGGCQGAVLLPLLQLLLNETAFGVGAETVDAAAHENAPPPPPQQQRQPCPFAPATPSTLPFDPFGDGGDALAAALPALAVSEPEAATPAPPPPAVRPAPPDDDEPFAALSPVPRRAPPPPPPAMRARANV